MKLEPFKLERYFAKYEFTTPYLLSCSDCEALSMKELLAMADKESKTLWKDLKFGYTESQGHPLLREEISGLYDSIQPENVLVLTPEEGIYITMNSLLQSGDHIVCTFPAYQSLYQVAAALGCQVSNWVPQENNEWAFDIEDLKKLIRRNTKLIVINFPHNPTGANISKEELESILKIARANNCIVFSDEMYRFLEYTSANKLSSACDLYENAISLFGMSKSFALPGLRIGWLASQNQALLNKIAIYKDYTTICNSAPSEILAIIGLRNKDQIIRRNLEIIQANLKILDEFFSDFDQSLSWIRPKAGPIGFPRIKLNVDVSAFCLDLAENEGILLVPSDQFNFGNKHFRIGFARKNMETALLKLKEYLRKKYTN